jgi:hypothetical protein
MRRLALTAVVILCALVAPAGALAAQPASATGTVTAIEASSFTIQTAGRLTGRINALTDAANAVTQGDYPYVWGGGHAEAGVAGVGIKGPGHNGRRIGYDCSGSVAAVLAGAGLWPAGSPVPSDAGVIKQLFQDKLIARGAGTAPDEVTLYDDPGVHIFMNIDGRFFGTSDGGGGGNPKGGAGWLSDGAPDASTSAFKRYHLLPSVLKDKTTYGHDLTYQIDPGSSVIAGANVGDDLDVTYQGTGVGSMVASGVTWVGAVTTSGTVTAIASDDSSFTVQSASGQAQTFSTGTNPSLAGSLQVGDSIDVSYTSAAGALTARSLTVTATPAPAQATGTIVAVAADGSTFTIQTAAGQDMTFSTGDLQSLPDVGAEVEVSYTQGLGGILTAVQLTGQPS